nr:peroxide stress protein YaaA [Oribacterium sp. NK2B42]
MNLASKEYSKCVEKYLRPEDTFITVTFGETANGKLVTKGTYAKMARGEMVRFMAENMIEDPNEIKTFDRLGYVFMDELSNSDELVFERRK